MSTMLEPDGRSLEVLDGAQPKANEPTPRHREPAPEVPSAHTTAPPSAVRTSIDPRQVARLVGLWLVVVLTSVALIAYGLGSVLEHRHQRVLLHDFRVKVDNAANAVQSLNGYQPPKIAPALGSAVAILEIGRLRLQQVVVEGAGSAQSEHGPGHVPGTAGPGQPGNSVVVGRRLAFGGPFNRLNTLRRGDRIVITTPQGQSVYSVDSVAKRSTGAATYGPSKDDRLTLVTSASALPTNSDRATVVTATMMGLPFAPTPQGALSPSTDGRHRDSSTWPLLTLLGLALACAAVAAVFLYRRWRPLSTYLLTTPVLISLAVLLGEAAVRLLPAWA